MSKFKKIVFVFLVLVFVPFFVAKADSVPFSVPYNVNAGGNNGGEGGNNGGGNSVSVSLTANSYSVGYGGSTVLAYSSANAVSCYGDGGNFGGSKNSSGTHYHNTGGLTSNHTYTFSCSGVDGSSASQSVTINVGGAEGVSASMSANPSNVTVGGSSDISWGASGASSCATNGGPWGSGHTLATGGTITRSDFNYSGSFTYHVICYGVNGGHSTASATVTAGGQPTAQHSVILYVNGQRSTTVPMGDTVTLSWDVTGSVDSCTAHPENGNWRGSKGWGSGSESGIGPVVGNTEYRLDCVKVENGVHLFSSSTVSVYTTAPTHSVTLYANGQRSATVPQGDTVTLSWDVTGSVDSCTAHPENGNWRGSKGWGSGSESGIGPVMSNTEYRIDCVRVVGGNYLFVTSIVPVYTTAPSFGVSIYVNGKKNEVVNAGDTVTVSWDVHGAINNCVAHPNGNWNGHKGWDSGSESDRGPVTENTVYTIGCENGNVPGHWVYDNAFVTIKKNVTIIEF